MIENDNPAMIFRAEGYLINSINLFRDNGEPEEGERVHHKLIDLQNKIPPLMPSVSVTQDFTDQYNQIEQLFEELSFKEHIITIVQITKLFKKNDLKKWFLILLPLSHLCSALK